ncbi:MAG: starch-binding protein, partial [Oscillospiraceae bacterium]|nr:starch-binding protein [Oscillospiraceae bacterium]
MKTFKKSMAIILSILMLFSVMTVAGISASAADEETVSIYFVNSGNWDTVSSYVWVSGGVSLKAWPGTAMTATDEKAANGADIYVLEYVDAGYDRVIFNDGKATDTIQTETIVLKHGLYYDYLSQSWYTDATLEEEVTDPTVDPSQIKYYVAGDAGLCGENWNPKGEAGLMADNGDGTYTVVF